MLQSLPAPVKGTFNYIALAANTFALCTPIFALSTLKLIGEKLIAIHSQHATQEVNDSDFQLLIVDSLMIGDC